MKSDHDKITDLLADYIHGRLTDEMAAWVKGHLLRCDDCASELYIAESLLKIEVPEPQSAYFNNMTRVVLICARANAPEKINLWRYIFRPIPITAAASLCLVIYLVIFNLGNFHSGYLQIAAQGNVTEKKVLFESSASDDILYSLIEEEYSDGLSYGGVASINDDNYDAAEEL
ncbi:MAG: zf-HC2 domain-containing protein [Nitrospirae bacterium]|nr:zf-HC2 domain-containing protein [Nitrospirota bacterium]